MYINVDDRYKKEYVGYDSLGDSLLGCSVPQRPAVTVILSSSEAESWSTLTLDALPDTLSPAWRVTMLTAEHTALPVVMVRRVEGDVRGTWLLCSLRATASCPLPAVVLSNESLCQLSTKCFQPSLISCSGFRTSTQLTKDKCISDTNIKKKPKNILVVLITL